MSKVQQQVYSRPPWERMMRMHQLIKSGKYPNCSKLAREFEVVTRTIKRDIDFMKDRLELRGRVAVCAGTTSVRVLREE